MHKPFLSDQYVRQFGLKSLRLGRALETGFVLTVEPGIYFNEHLTASWAASKQFTAFINYPRVEQIKNFGGIRIENDLKACVAVRNPNMGLPART